MPRVRALQCQDLVCGEEGEYASFKVDVLHTLEVLVRDRLTLA